MVQCNPGFAQLVESPTTFHIQPMQIDTKNREYNGSDFRPGPLPSTAASPPDAAYSGLLECPCTDRLTKVVEQTYATKTFGACIKPVTNATECFLAVAKVQGGEGSDLNVTVASGSLPAHCALVIYTNGSTVAYYNQGSSRAQCGGAQVRGAAT